MRLIGLLGSPYVRRVAISLDLMGVAFDHELLSVFRDEDRFAAINPLVKAPTLVTDEGVVLMDSTLILDHVEADLPEARRLSRIDPHDRLRATRLMGLVLAACEKTVQLAYEFELRPAERRHDPWIDRVRRQMSAGWSLIEAELGAPDPWLFGPRPTEADVMIAVAWSFARVKRPQEATAEDHPRLEQFAARAEATPAFLRWPMP